MGNNAGVSASICLRYVLGALAAPPLPPPRRLNAFFDVRWRLLPRNPTNCSYLHTTRVRRLLETTSATQTSARASIPSQHVLLVHALFFGFRCPGSAVSKVLASMQHPHVGTGESEGGVGWHPRGATPPRTSTAGLNRPNDRRAWAAWKNWLLSSRMHIKLVMQASPNATTMLA